MSKNPHYSVLSSSNHIQKFLTGSIIRNAKLNRYICQEKSTNKATPTPKECRCVIFQMWGWFPSTGGCESCDISKPPLL